MSNIETRRLLAEARTGRERIFSEIQNLQARAEVDGHEGIEERLGNLNRGLQAADDRIADLEQELGRYAYIERQAQDPRNIDGYQESAERRYDGPRSEARDKALKTIERFQDRFDGAESQDRMDTLIREEKGDLLARYISAVGDENYRSAFRKMLADPTTGQMKLTPAEGEAIRRMAEVEGERALNITTGSAGQFALPLTLDPSILLSSAGALNPIRKISRGISVTTNRWTGVSSDGVTVSYVAEATAAGDASPVLAQPIINCAQWRAFVPFSIEAGQDWAGLEAELVRLVDDGRNTNDATQFYTGTGTNAPQGLMTGLSASQRVATSGATAFAVADPWLLSAAIPNRFRSSTTYAAAPATWDKIYRFVGTNSTEPLQMPSRDGSFLGQPKVEWSSVGTQWTTTGGTVLVGGDFNQYAVVDRVGITAELIPHLFSGATAGSFGYPMGQRGLYTYGRTGAGVLVPNAFRALVVA
jgi:HK97 family phage major capsid protein